jgi:hypothetical protein
MITSISANGAKPALSGYFVDWDSRIREAANPGDGMSCVVIKGDHMEVINSEGETTYECTRFDSIAAIQAVAPNINPVIVGSKKRPVP